jgi:murein DD-endopeptidase MepM/ murein hydrolase activator NlpD
MCEYLRYSHIKKVNFPRTGAIGTDIASTGGMNEKTYHLLLLNLIVVLCLSLLLGCSPSTPAPTPETPAIPKLAPAEPSQKFDDPRIQAIDDLLQQVSHQRTDILALVIYKVRIDHVDFSSDGTLALVWVKFIDPDTNAFVPGELSLSIAHQEKDAQTGTLVWKLYFQADKDWVKMLNSVPVKMLSAALRANYMPDEQPQQKDGKVFTGYKLPWEGGKSKYLTGSIGHVFTYKTCPADCLYAFDFADGTEFPVLAAKSGKVKYAVWQYPDNQMEHANLLVLTDTTTTPTTYMLYYHLAQNSIPAALRVPGAEVLQGQFIANADNTGPSTGHHLHFMVHTDPKSFWGTSVDIVFSDVSVNGGRPRTCAEAHYFPNYGSQCMPSGLYMSRNADMDRPTGFITKPVTNLEVKTRKLTVSGYGTDDTAVKSIQLMYTYDGVWQPAASTVNGAKFTSTVDLCTLKIPDGDFFLSVLVTDKSGKVSADQQGMIHLIKNYSCVPTATPTATDTKTLRPTKTPTETRAPRVKAPTKTPVDTKTPLPSKTPRSSKTSVPATVVPPSKTERPLANNPPTKTPLPAKPEAPTLHSPLTFINGEVTDQQDLTLTWTDSGDKLTYSATLKGPSSGSMQMNWQAETAWVVGKLPAGKYTWTVTARNAAGTASTSMTFNVSFSDAPPTSQLEPLLATQKSSAILLKWKVISGLVDLDGFEIQYRDNGGKWTDYGQKFTAADRQTWFVGEVGHTYSFRIHSFDKHGSIEPYPDNAQTKTAIETACTPDNYDKKNSDGTLLSAAKISVGQTQTHNFCPKNDVDWIQFTTQAGKTYDIKTWPVSGAAATSIEVIAGDGKDIKAHITPSTPDGTTVLKWKAREGKIYFIRIKPFDNNLAGTNTSYNISVVSENLPWYYYTLVLPLALLGWGGYKGVKWLKAKRAASGPAAASQGYAAETRGIPLSFADNPPPLPRKQRVHKNFNEAWTSLVIWANQTTRRLRGEPVPHKLSMARRPRRL